MRFGGLTALGAALMLCGCSTSMSYVVDEYSGVPVKEFVVTDRDAYRVFDKPDANKLMITPSLARAASSGFVSGMTFGAVSVEDSAGRRPELETAALGFLASTGRKCRITDGYAVLRGQWEFKYDCSVPAAVSPARR